jgi:hypothetical protein
MNYNLIAKTVTQTLGSIDSDNLEGAFSEVTNRILAEYGYYKKFLEEAQEVSETNYRGGAYLDGERTKKVKFDKIYLVWHDSHDDTKVLHVMGDRPMDAGELAALAEETKKRETAERQMLKKLKEKYPDEN